MIMRSQLNRQFLMSIACLAIFTYEARQAKGQPTVRVDAGAEDSVMVLGIYAEPSDIETADVATELLRSELELITGWRLSPKRFTLSQMAVAFGCDETDMHPACLDQIAKAHGAGHLLIGSIQTSKDKKRQITLQLFGHAKKDIERALIESLGTSVKTVDVQYWLSKLSDRPWFGSLVVQTNGPSTKVTLDDRLPKFSDKSGIVRFDKVEPKEHYLVVEKGSMIAQAVRFALQRAEEKKINVSLAPKARPAQRKTTQPSAR